MLSRFAPCVAKFSLVWIEDLEKLFNNELMSFTLKVVAVVTDSCLDRTFSFLLVSLSRFPLMNCNPETFWGDKAIYTSLKFDLNRESWNCWIWVKSLYLLNLRSSVFKCLCSYCLLRFLVKVSGVRLMLKTSSNLGVVRLVLDCLGLGLWCS